MLRQRRKGREPRAEDESGAVIVLFVIMLPLFIAMMAMSIDLFRVYDVRNQMSQIADMAAKAGAEQAYQQSLAAGVDCLAVPGEAVSGTAQSVGQATWSSNFAENVNSSVVVDSESIVVVQDGMGGGGVYNQIDYPHPTVIVNAVVTVPGLAFAGAAFGRPTITFDVSGTATLSQLVDNTNGDNLAVSQATSGCVASI